MSPRRFIRIFNFGKFFSVVVGAAFFVASFTPAKADPVEFAPKRAKRASGPIHCKFFAGDKTAPVAAGGDLISIPVTADPVDFRRGHFAQRCGISVTTVAPWMSIQPPPALDRLGHSELTVRVQPNRSGVQRTGTIRIGGRGRTNTNVVQDDSVASVHVTQIFPKPALHAGNVAPPTSLFREAGGRLGNRAAQRITLIPAEALDQMSNSASGDVVSTRTAKRVLPKGSDESGPVIADGGVVSAASFLPSISPGQLISIFGSGLANATKGESTLPLPTTDAGTSVSVNGILCPLLFLSASQINAQLPGEIQPGPALINVTVGDVTASQAITIAEASPGLFTSDYGTTALVQTLDGSLVSADNPALPGQIVILYGTGIGPVAPTVADGYPAQSGANLSRAASDVQVLFGGVAAQVLFAGLAPGFVGLFQMNIMLPEGIPSGTVPILISAAGDLGSPVETSIAGGVSSAPLTVTSFSSNPSSIVEGGYSALEWVTTGATSVSIDQGIGPVNPNGSLSISPDETTTYTLTATGPAGTAYATTTIEVTSAAEPVIQYFSVGDNPIYAGQSTTLSWDVDSATDVSIDNGIGSVPLDGYFIVSPASTTTYTLTASNGETSVTAQVTVTVNGVTDQMLTLVFNNELLADAEITVNGTDVGSIEAGQTQQISVPAPTTLNVSYTATETDSEGDSIGDPMSAAYEPIDGPSGTYNFNITAQVGSQFYFAPVITNDTGVTLLMEVNGGLDIQNQCNCTVPSTEQPYNIGYYLLDTNSNVEAYQENSNYAGPYQYFMDFFDQWQNSGEIDFTFTVAP